MAAPSAGLSETHDYTNMTTQTQVHMTATCHNNRPELSKRGPLPRGVSWSNTVRLMGNRSPEHGAQRGFRSLQDETSGVTQIRTTQHPESRGTEHCLKVLGLA